MSGRGNLLNLFNKKTRSSEISSSSEYYENDCGFNIHHSTSSGEFHRLPKDNIGSDLLKTIKNMDTSVGRGRAQFVQTFKSNETNLGKRKDDTSSIQSKDTINNESTSSLENSKVHNDEFFPNVVHGSKGSSVILSCNYIELKTDENKGVYQYEVRFFPAVDSVHLRIKYLNEHMDKIGGTKTFDGASLYLPILLENQMTVLVSKSMDTEVEIRILFKKKEPFKNCLHLYNILFDRIMKTLNYVRFDRKQFDPSCPKIIPQAKLEVWPGYVTAVDELEGGLMLCCDVSHRILCQRTVLDMLIDIYKKNINSYQDLVKKTLIGNIVITRYNNRTYKISEVCFNESPQSIFHTKTGPTSYVQYYTKYHNINIKDINQPLLLSIKKARGTPEDTENIEFRLVPELCYLTGLRDDIRSNNKLMREIATYTRVTPNQRKLALDKFYDNVSNTPAAREILDRWGLALFRNLNNLKGRQLDSEQIYFGKKVVTAGQNAEFSKDAVKNEMLEAIHLNNWIIIHFKTDLRAAISLLDNMKQCCRPLGMNISKPKIISLDHDRINEFIDALRRNIVMETQIVVCICPNSRDDRYSAIKKICCLELPVPSQVINAKTLCNETKNRSVVQKILLQMNCKMGGSLWTVKIPFKSVMICGIDSYHDPSNRGNSVAAFVASLNASYTQWYSKAVIQTKSEEIVNGLTSSFEAALNSYKKRNGCLPESVIIYRDGVGDGQLSTCSRYEIPQFASICDNRIKLTFIVVQKRVNTRIFSGSANQLDNPLPGTLVDEHITRAHMYDFFLVSQLVRQGTVSPTHFIVLQDDAKYGPDIIQKLSYKLCFLYYNWSGTIRIPACCMYAHKLAYLIGQSIQRNVADSLSMKLFYL
ncbi:protein argonaute-3 isoform X1 [Drosophila pseudoobscura]|uniref:Protein argonaute-3 isoform X1 n=1 Tax=Drosophila pseudoobscura pseudoobscura TaxID=46245 RepID=A0A6I8W076_DROPS|nr:protein argonaute-3 isoform X1 [Drosophila pseudoobscura]XP_033236663.1 protein argonaute-3 isoform X1 [Drosophila pseudoobscura]